MFSSGNSHKYVHRLEYRYNAPGTFTGRRLRFTPVMQSRVAAERLVKMYPVGKNVDVYHDPSNPKSSVLERGGGLSLLALPPVALVFVCAAVALLGWVELPIEFAAATRSPTPSGGPS